MNLLLDWAAIETELKKYYNKGCSVAGHPSYGPLLLFKMLLLQTWYGLSDYEVEEGVNDSLSFMAFTGLSLEDPVPDNTVLSRFPHGPDSTAISPHPQRYRAQQFHYVME